MRERAVFSGILCGLFLGVATLYGGVLLSTCLPIPVVFYGLPLAFLVMVGVLAGSVSLLKNDRCSNRSWRGFAITFVTIDRIRRVSIPNSQR
ncbi:MULTISPECIES: hypothetical protein [Corynebacterium]|uniref:hypothetical protein n=1 Tax=Corynebacterium TaxID=1716 RepID=UPI0019595F75|nr:MULTISPECIES: hypothetical protein [Corynebacterium]QRQ65542.1 hypothetical protein I6J23_03630 [Corynebacterium kroppenstedtii]